MTAPKIPAVEMHYVYFTLSSYAISFSTGMKIHRFCDFLFISNLITDVILVSFGLVSTSALCRHMFCCRPPGDLYKLHHNFNSWVWMNLVSQHHWKARMYNCTNFTFSDGKLRHRVREDFFQVSASLWLSNILFGICVKCCRSTDCERLYTTLKPTAWWRGLMGH